MKSEIYWIDGPWKGRVAILARPRGGDWLDAEVRAWAEAGLDVIVSLLTKEEIEDLNLNQEAEMLKAEGISFISFPIIDRSIPSSRNNVLDLINELDRLLAEGKSIGIHCRQGIGRSALIAASLLVRSGLEPEEAFRKVSIARGCSVPETSEQRKWVNEFEREPAALTH